MRYWDSSAVVPLLVSETRSDAMRTLAERDVTMLVWWGTEVECASAVARVERDGGLTAPAADAALKRLYALKRGWNEVQPRDAVRRDARRLLRVHPLRAADATQLAAALAAAEGDPSSLEVVTLDERLADAARREGFPVVAVDTP